MNSLRSCKGKPKENYCHPDHQAQQTGPSFVTMKAKIGCSPPRKSDPQNLSSPHCHIAATKSPARRNRIQIAFG
jgi:hypothetical protein